MTGEEFNIVLSVFLVGLLSFFYGEKVNHEQVSIAMGILTLASVAFLPLLILYIAVS